MTKIGLTGMNAATEHMKVISQKIANANTYGFKGQEISQGDTYSAGAGAVNATSGTGVKVTKAINFDQGAFENTGKSLDLAIEGNGLFIVEKDGARHYTRAGRFKIDKNGHIVNNFGLDLIGYKVNANGNISGALGKIKVDAVNLESKKTTQIDMSLNLNETITPPTRNFERGFTHANPPHVDSYNFAKTTQVYDSLGRRHNVTSYYVKDKQVNTWQIYIGINGNDVTPRAANRPQLNNHHANYANNALAKPFTVKFDERGNYIPHDARSAQFFGAQAYNSVQGQLVNVGTYNQLNAGDLVINGINIEQINNVDRNSNIDNNTSAISLAASINEKTNLHGVIARANPNTFRLVNLQNANNALVGDNLVINNVQIISNGNVANRNGLLQLINAQTAQTGIVATPAQNNAGDIILTGEDGRNINIRSDGAGQLTFNNVVLNNNTPSDSVIRSTIRLDTQNNHVIKIDGNNNALASMGLTAGYKKGIVIHSSDKISIRNFNPGNGANFAQELTIDLKGTTQYGTGFATYNEKQNGNGVGVLSGVNVNKEGLIQATFNNGNNKTLGQISLVQFRDVNNLAQLGNACFAETVDSGAALLGKAGSSGLGTILSKNLELSNEDITQAMVKLLDAQHSFQANAQSTKVESSLLSIIMNIFS